MTEQRHVMSFSNFCLVELGMVPGVVQRTLEHWLHEDCGHGDLTIKAMGGLLNAPGVAQIVAKDDCVIAGLPLAAEIFRMAHGIMDGAHGDVSFAAIPRVVDRERVAKGTVLLELQGNSGALLLAERTALNLFSRLCGIATYTAKMVERLEEIRASRPQGNKIPRLLETRKTTPGLKIFEKYATRAGGAHNHRMGLDAGAMLKENHFSAGATAGLSFGETLQRARSALPLLAGLEVEVTSLEEFQIALASGVPVIMLDNFSLTEAAQAVAQRDAARSQTLLEISGNLDRRNLVEIVDTGVDLMSMGALIHQATWSDLSLRFVSRES